MNSIKLWLSIPVFAMLAACGDDGHESPVQGPEDDPISEEILSSSSGKVSSSSRENNVSSSESDKKSSSSTNYVCSIYTLSDALSCKCNSSVEGKLSYNYDSNVELVCYHDEELDKWGWITNPSASDEDESSSSTAESSSSEIEIVMAEPCRDDTEDNCEYDTLEDERDGESYKTVKIGPQEWMTENLRYEGEESYCFEDKEANCPKGRLYTWNAALSACPDGWHLPTYVDFLNLMSLVSGRSDISNKAAYRLLYSPRTGTKNPYGFSAIYTYTRSSSGYYSNHSSDPSLWSATSTGAEKAYYLSLTSLGGEAYLHESASDMARPIRCMKGVKNTAADDDSPYSGSYGTLEDSRDGKSYKTVVIGDQTWMAENLNLETEGSICNGDDPENCEKYGRLYSWAMAMDSAGVYSKNGEDCGFYQSCSARNPVRGVCPTGWHLPSYGEVEKLIETVGGADIAGKRLKATSSWVNDYNGKDTYGFSALAGGFKYFMEESMRDVGGSAAFWTSDRLTGDTKYAFRLFIQASDDDAGLTLLTVTSQLSVRCLKD